MAEAALKAHGLDGWTLAWLSERTRRVLGQCDYREKAIRLSLWYVRQNTKNHVRGTVLHEVAHALVGPKVQSHGVEWKAKCVEIGAAPDRLSRDARGCQPPVRRMPKWQAVCCDCGATIRRTRLSWEAERGLLRHVGCVTLLLWTEFTTEPDDALMDSIETTRWPLDRYAETFQRHRTVLDKTWDLKESLGLSGHEPAATRIAGSESQVGRYLFAKAERRRACHR